jgi:hypothetical protein
MKKPCFKTTVGCLSGILLASAAFTADAQTNFTVTTPNFIYAVNGLAETGSPGEFVQNSPTLTVTAGNTYTFTMEANAIHPMVVGTNFSTTPTTSPSTFEYSGASPQIVSSGTITLTIPAVNFPSKLYYQCNNHGFYGIINVMPPTGAPPRNIIISLVVGATNVVVTSSGTNTTYTLVPQYNSNLVSGTWKAVPSFTNTFSNGTNITSFGRLDAICGPNVFLRVSQQPPP